MSLQTRCHLSTVAVLLFLVCLPSYSVGQEPVEKHPFAVLAPLASELRTTYLPQGITLDGGIKAHSIMLANPGVKGAIAITIDPNPRQYGPFGDILNSKLVPHQTYPAIIKLVRVDDPSKIGRRLYQIESEKLGNRLFIVGPGKNGGECQLLVHNKEGKVESVHPLMGTERRPPPPPCHPGCFPAGTLVETPKGARKIETLQPGDVILNIRGAGKPEPIKIASVFTGQSPLVEITTADGKLITTGKQPLSLANGDLKSASELKEGDQLQRWRNGKTFTVKVRDVKALDGLAPIFNLVLEERGTFIANGYLVRSKPPIEK